MCECDYLLLFLVIFLLVFYGLLIGHCALKNCDGIFLNFFLDYKTTQENNPLQYLHNSYRTLHN